MEVVMRHEARQVPSWLIFDVGQNMIHRTQVTFTAYGERFAPSKVLARFSDAHDPGAIAKTGRYRGKPTPYGSASFDAPEEEPQKIEYLHRLVVPLLPALRDAGANDFWLRITYHSDSGALGFSKREIVMLAEMECDVPIDCVIEKEPNKAPEPTTMAVTPRATEGDSR